MIPRIITLHSSVKQPIKMISSEFHDWVRQELRKLDFFPAHYDEKNPRTSADAMWQAIVMQKTND